MAVSSGSRINTNIAALNALNALNAVNSDLAVHQLRLASGKRINSAADDASGYVISQKMSGTINALQAASNNVGDATNLLSVAEGGYQTISDLLTQMKDKITSFNNAGYGSQEQDALAGEIDQLAKEIDDAQSQTAFNGKAVINGSFSMGSTVDATGGVVVGTSLASGTGAASVSAMDVSGAKGGATFTFTAGTNSVTLDDGAGHSQTVSTAVLAQGGSESLNFDTLGVKVTLLGNATSTSAQEIADSLGTKTVKTTAGSAPSWQVGESASEVFSVSLSTDVSSAALLGVAGGSITAANMSTVAANIDSAINTVLSANGAVGAAINRLSSKSDMLQNAITNTQAAQSRIQDADIAQEQIASVKDQILQQTATAQLAQANSSPQVFLRLFQ